MLFTLALTWAGVIPPDLTLVLALDCFVTASLVWLCWHTRHCLGKQWASRQKWPNGPSKATHGEAKEGKESELQHPSQPYQENGDRKLEAHIPEKPQLRSPRPRCRINDSPLVKPAKPPVRRLGPARSDAERAGLGKGSRCQERASSAGDVILEGTAELGYGSRSRRSTKSSGSEI